MSETPRRFEGLRRWTRYGAVLGGASALVLIAIGVRAITSVTDGDSAARFYGSVAVAMGAILLGLFVCMCAMVSLLIKMEAHSFRSYDILRELQAQSTETGDDIRTVADNVQLSEVARSISHRNKERTVLRLAINEEIIRGDWEAAYALVEQLEARHGYKNEAARLRAELDKSRDLNRRHAVKDAVEHVKAYMEAHDWDLARREMDDLLASNPLLPEIQALPALFDKLRSQHKRRLLKTWDEAVQRNEIDRGIATLKELDQYLTPNEAAALEESARGVFQAKLHNLGVQFSLSVAENNWDGALSIGNQIVDEFPNSRMAQEFRERIHILEKRASQSREAEKVTQA